MDIEHNIRNAKTITWMAEYNTNCIEKIKGNALGIVGIYGIAEVLGPSDVYIDSMERFFKENSIKSGHLDLSDWDKSITGFLDGLRYYYDIPVDQVDQISLSGNPAVDYEDLKSLKYFPALKNLQLESCAKVNDECLKLIGSLQIEKLSVENCRDVTDTGLKYIAQGCQNMKELNLRRCGLISDVGVVEIARNCVQLKTLLLSKCSKITDASMIEIGQNLKDLAKLDLYDCKNISNKGMEAIASCPLEYLNLRSCDLISDDGLQYLSKQLKYLNMRNLQITDKGVESVPSTVQNLILQGCDKLTNSALDTISKNCPNLTSLHLDNCKHITDTGLTSLHNLSLISLGISFIPTITYDGIKSVSSPSLLYLHNAGCPLINRPETLDSIKSWSPHIKYIASTKQAICPEDPKYSDHDVIIEERNISLWVRAEDLNKTGHSPGDLVSEWRDYSDSNITFKFREDPEKVKLFTRPNFGFIDKNKVHSVQFFGTSTICATVENLAFVNDFTIFLIKKNPRASVPNRSFFDIHAVLSLYDDGAGNNKYIVQASGPWTRDYICTPILNNTEQVHLITYVRQGTNMILRQHNHPPLVKPGSPGPLKGNKPFLYVLGDRGAFGADKLANTKPVDFIEMICFKEAFSEEKIQEMFCYLQQKYQFEVPLC